ncbi:Uncharacterised protein [Yersinia frederiksenii]|nr:Uncharacterised protein [Yersinia frederiksenii]
MILPNYTRLNNTIWLLPISLGITRKRHLDIKTSKRLGVFFVYGSHGTVLIAWDAMVKTLARLGLLYAGLPLRTSKGTLVMVKKERPHVRGEDSITFELCLSTQDSTSTPVQTQ